MSSSFVDIVARSGNQAVSLNPPHGLDIHITSHGSDFYWALFSFFAFVGIVFLVLGFVLRPTNERLFFYNAIASLFFLTITYYTMASDLGWTGIQAEFNHATVSKPRETPGIRQIFYARYVGWFLALPPLIANIAIISALSWPTIIFTIFSIETFVVALLIGSLIHSTYKWGYFVFAVVALFLVGFNLLFSFRRAAVASSQVFTSTFTGSVLTGLLFIYPIAWALAEGGNVIQPDSEAVFYGVLDLCVFALLQGYFLFVVRDVELKTLGIVPPVHPIFQDKTPIDNRNSTYSADTAVHPLPVVAVEQPVVATSV